MESGYAKAGVLLDGTPANFLEEQATVDEIDVQRGNQASEQRAMGYEVNSKSLLGAADWSRSVGESESSAYKTAATSSLIGGLGKAAIKFDENYEGDYPSWLGGSSNKRT
jgi:hypothetical protein